ncbi:glycoside hydrolase family 28 protein [Filimonas effusa]|uniref:Glycoside hydrolase family 28 protein n=1 Tax=Filimonas effusa TaxID=2508721 RepID=A0A4Q1DCR1_9BACT|nr:glycoside hydrolase family 28 protein [Filimonas effusa]RXK86329.1 glycoside hydrolase family 28 protein [Filimonas effusa]
MSLLRCFSTLLLGAGLLSQANAQSTKAKEYSWKNLPVAKLPVFKKDTVNIRSFGAVNDGFTLNTASINNAIAACSKKGGGVVLIPQGLWLTGPIVMQNNVNLHVSRPAVLQFTADFNQYPLVEGNYEGVKSARNQSPISGANLVNIAITGSGIIDGNGGVWHLGYRDRYTESQWKKKTAAGGIMRDDGKVWYPTEKSKKGAETKNNGILTEGKTLKDFEDVKDFLRPNMVVFTSCKKILLEGVTFQNSPAWCLHPLMCEDLTLRNVFVKNPETAPNGDGLDLESCKNVLVEGSTFDVGDDGICIKSGRDEEGRKRGMPTENVVIRNNVVYHAHGGVVVGSEMSGGARNIFVYDCSFIGSDIGLRFKTVRGRGGVVEKIYAKNISMRNIVGEAILFDMYYFVKAPVGVNADAVPPVTEATPQFRDFYFSDIVCNGASKGIFVRGIPEMHVKNVNLENMTLQVDKGIEIIEASNIKLKNINIISKLNNPVVYVQNSKDVVFNGVQLPKDAKQLFKISGGNTTGIQILGAKDVDQQKDLSFTDGAIPAAVSKFSK